VLSLIKSLWQQCAHSLIVKVVPVVEGKRVTLIAIFIFYCEININITIAHAKRLVICILRVCIKRRKTLVTVRAGTIHQKLAAAATIKINDI